MVQCEGICKNGARCLKKVKVKKDDIQKIFCHLHKSQKEDSQKEDSKKEDSKKEEPLPPSNLCQTKMKNGKYCKKQAFDGKCNLHKERCSDKNCRNKAFYSDKCYRHFPLCQSKGCASKVEFDNQKKMFRNFCFSHEPTKCFIFRCKNFSEKHSYYCSVHTTKPGSYNFVYSKSKNSVEVTDPSGIKTWYPIRTFNNIFIRPYLSKGVMNSNKYGLNQQNAEYFLGKDTPENNPIYNSSPDITYLKNTHGITDRKSYKKWCIKNHPDKNKNENTTEIFKKVSVMVDKCFPE